MNVNFLLDELRHDVRHFHQFTLQPKPTPVCSPCPACGHGSPSGAGRPPPSSGTLSSSSIEWYSVLGPSGGRVGERRGEGGGGGGSGRAESRGGGPPDLCGASRSLPPFILVAVVSLRGAPCGRCSTVAKTICSVICSCRQCCRSLR